MLVLCALFLMMGMGMAILGGSIYQKTAAQSSENTTCRTALSYITNQVRGADDVFVTDLGGLSALAVTSEYGGDRYVTYLYCHDGQLCELFTELNNQLEPSVGTPLIEIHALDFSVEGGTVTFTVTDEKDVRSCLTLAPRGGIGEVVE